MMETSAAYCWGIPSEYPSTAKMECKQKKLLSWGCSIAKGKHWEKQMANGKNC